MCFLLLHNQHTKIQRPIKKTVQCPSLIFLFLHNQLRLEQLIGHVDVFYNVNFVVSAWSQFNVKRLQGKEFTPTKSWEDFFVNSGHATA